MRRTNTIQPLLVGLAMLACHGFFAVLPATAWEWNSLFAKDDPQPAESKSPAVAVQVQPTAPRWTDGQAVQQAYAQDTQSTGGVEQTAHTGPSRGGTLFGSPNTTRSA